jgi:hypothetical protein
MESGRQEPSSDDEWVGQKDSILTLLLTFFKNPKLEFMTKSKNRSTLIYTQILECTTVGVTDAYQPRQTRFRVLKILSLHTTKS